MKLSEVMRVIDGKPITRAFDANLEVETAFGADLMSDALMCAQEGTLLMTGIINPQAVRTAEMVSSQAIMFVRCKIPQVETIKLAEEKNIHLIACPYTMFEACGRLYDVGLKSCDLPDTSLRQWRERFGKG